MKRHISYIAVVLALQAGSLPSLMAQDLHTEITVDRTVQPELAKAQRPTGLVPSVLTPQVDATTLTVAEYTSSAWPENETAVLTAPAYADSTTITPWRGYASVGYLPLYNLGISAGYRVVEGRAGSIDLWGQYNGYSYNGDIPNFPKALFTNHYLTGGGDFELRLGSNAVLSGRGSATHSSIRIPYYLKTQLKEGRWSYTQGANQLDGMLRLSARASNLLFDIKGSAGYFGIDMAKPAILRLNDQRLRQAWGEGQISIGCCEDDAARPWIGVDMDIVGLRTTNLLDGYINFMERFVTLNLFEGHARPYMRFDNEKFEGLVGVNISAGKNYDAHLRIAPSARVSCTPLSFMSMYVSAEGGEYINMMKDIYALNPYIDPWRAYGRTNVPLVARAGVNLGPYDGMSLAVRGGYAMARDLLSPQINIERTGYMRSVLYTADVNSWFVGAHLALAYQDLISLDFDIATGGADSPSHSWIDWYDAAKVVSNVTLSVQPIQPLRVALSYDLRYERKARSQLYSSDSPSLMVDQGIPNLGTVNDVNITGQYTINEQITAYIEVRNLLCSRYLLVSGMPGPSIHGLMGVSCKF